MTQPPVWNSAATKEEKAAYRAEALAYLKYAQREAKNKNVDYATKYRRMTESEDLEDAFEDLKERIEFITINA